MHFPSQNVKIQSVIFIIKSWTQGIDQYTKLQKSWSIEDLKALNPKACQAVVKSGLRVEHKCYSICHSATVKSNSCVEESATVSISMKENDYIKTRLEIFSYKPATSLSLFISIILDA